MECVSPSFDCVAIAVAGNSTARHSAPDSEALRDLSATAARVERHERTLAVKCLMELDISLRVVQKL